MLINSHLIYVILGYLCIAYTSAERLTFEVPNRDKFCFLEIFTKVEKWIFQFAVIRGGGHDIDIPVKAPGGTILFDGPRRKEAKFDFDSQPGEYEVCFSNEFSMFEHKVVFFTLESVETLAEEAG